MSGEIYQIETRRRSRSKTPFLRSSCDHENCEHAGEEGHVHHKKKKPSMAPNVQTIVEEHVVETRTTTAASSKSNKATSVSSKALFSQLTSDYSSDDATPLLRRKEMPMPKSVASASTSSKVTTMLSSTGKRLGNALHNLTTAATSTPRNLQQEQMSFSSRSNSSRMQGNGGGSNANLSPDHIAYIEYRDAGEYWNKTPKTDYTYSELSPHRRQLAPGIVAMPNMSRRSLEHHDERVDFMVNRNPAEEEYIRRRYQSKYTAKHLDYDSTDEVDITRFGQQQQQQSWWLMRFISFIVTTMTNTWTRITTTTTTNSSNNISTKDTLTNRRLYSLGKDQQHQQQGLIMGSLSSLYRFVYLGITSVLSLDTWLLRTENTEQQRQRKKRFLLFLLMLLPLLLLAGWWQLPQEQRLAYVQRGESLLPLSVFASLPARLTEAATGFKSWLPLGAEPVATKLQVEQTQQQLRQALTPEEYENILNHVNSYVQQLVELKLEKQQQQQQGEAKQLSQQQINIIVQLMRDNLQQFAAEQATQQLQLSEQQLQQLAALLKRQLQETGATNLKLTAEQLEEITTMIKVELGAHEKKTLLLLEQLDLSKLLRQLLSATELADFVDARIGLALKEQQEQDQQEESSTNQQIDQLNREIAFIKLALSDKLAENADLQQSISTLKVSQDDLLARLQQHELAQQQRFGTLLAEIESKFSALNRTQFELLNRQVKLTLVEILGFKQDGIELQDQDLQQWVRSVFVAKDYLEQQLLELNNRTNNHILEEIERSSLVLMHDISERLKREILVAVEAQRVNESNLQLAEDQVRGIVKSVLAIYDADKTGLADFALESGGGQILSTRCTESYQSKSAQITILGIPLWFPSNTPRVTISPNVQPGECWSFQGFPGFLVLKLSSLIYVSGFTMEHISKSLSPTGRIDSAPRNFTVWGLEHEKDYEPVMFGEYEYRDNDASLQYFAVQNMDIKRPYEIVELRIETNHGQPQYTCLYRFRVHGKPPPPSDEMTDTPNSS